MDSVLTGSRTGTGVPYLRHIITTTAYRKYIKWEMLLLWGLEMLKQLNQKCCSIKHMEGFLNSPEVLGRLQLFRERVMWCRLMLIRVSQSEPFGAERR